MLPIYLFTVFEQVFVRVAAVVSEVPNPGTGTAPPGVIQDRLLMVIGWIANGVSLLCLAGILFCAVKLLMAFRSGETAGVGYLGKVAAACVLVGSAGPIVNALI